MRVRAARRRASPRDWLAMLLLLLVLVPAMQFAWRMFEADWLALQPRQDMVKWGTGQAPLEVRTWVEARNRTQQALDLVPQNPMLHDLMAALYTLRGRQTRVGSPYEVSLYADAATHYRASLALRPGHGWAWAGLAEALLVQAPTNPQAWQAWQTAQQMAPHEMLVQSTLYWSAKRAGSHAPPQVQQWLHQTEQHAPPRLRGVLGLKPLDAPKK